MKLRAIPRAPFLAVGGDNEIADKSYINLRAVLIWRASLVERLYASEPGSDVVILPAGVSV